MSSEVISSNGISNGTSNGSSTIKYQSFDQLYAGICDRIKTTGSLDTIMEEFMKLTTDLERVTYLSKMEELQFMDVSLSKNNGKSETEAHKEEMTYERFIGDTEFTRKAIVAINRSIRKTPHLPDSTALAQRYMKRGWAWLLLEEFAHAEQDARRCTEKSQLSLEDSFLAYEILGHCYARKNQFKHAEGYFKKALEGLRKSDLSQEKKAAATGRIAIVFKNVKGKKDSKQKKDKNKSSPAQAKPPLPSVAYGRHKVLSNASSVVNVCCTAESGRGLYAARDIKPGDILIVEPPFASTMDPGFADNYCRSCFQPLSNPVPCLLCDKVFFCNESCRSAAMDSCHLYECKVAPLIQTDLMGKMALLVFGSIVKQPYDRITSRRSKLENLEKTIISQIKPKEETSQETTNTIDSITTDCDGLPNKKLTPWRWQGSYTSFDFDSTYCLVTNSDKRSFGDLLKRTISAVYTAFCLILCGYIPQEGKREESGLCFSDEFLYVCSLVLRLSQNASCNAYGITSLVGSGSILTADVEEVGGAIYPTVALGNHSCCPNTTRYSIGDACIVTAIKTIPKGHEIFDNYGPFFHSKSVSERNKLFNSQYKFNCLCNACKNDWPQYPHNEKGFSSKCPACSHRVIFKMDEFAEECAECGDSDTFSKLAQVAKLQLDLYSKGVRLLRERKENNGIRVLLEHQAFIDNYGELPSSHSTDTQEILRMALAHHGNFRKTEED